MRSSDLQSDSDLDSIRNSCDVLFELWYICFPPQDPHDPEYLSNPPHLAFVFGLTATNSALHTSSYYLTDTDTNTTREGVGRTYIRSRNVRL